MSLSVMHVVIAKTWGGGEQYVYDVCEEMKHQGINPYVVVDKRNKFLQQKYQKVATVLVTNLYTAAGLFGVADIVNFIRTYKLEVVNCHSGHALLACILAQKFTDAKLVMFKHNALPAKNDLYHKWQRKVVDAFICVSKLVYNLQTKNLMPNEINKFHLVYNGINTKRFQKYPNKNFRSNNKYIIGYAGRLAADKGIDLLIKAFSDVALIHKQVYLYIAGPDEKEDYTKQLKELVHNLHLQDRILFLGQVEDMEKFYKTIDLFVLPSKVSESFGLVLCEAIYCGVPVITTNSGAQQEIVTDNKYGWIITPNNQVELYKAIDYAITQKKVLANGKKYIKNTFSVFNCVNQLTKVYYSIR